MTAAALLPGENPVGKNTFAYDFTPSLKNVTSRFAMTAGAGAGDGIRGMFTATAGSAATLEADDRYFRNQSAARFDPTSKPAFE